MRLLRSSKLAFLLLFLLPNFLSAQKIQLVSKQYETRYPITGGSSSEWVHDFIVEGQWQQLSIGYFGQHLKKYLKSDSNAVKYMNTYATRQAFKLTTSVSTLAFLSAYIITNVANNSKESGKLDRNPGLLYAGLGSLAINLVFRLAPPASLQKAVDSYNDKVDKSEVSLSDIHLNLENVAGNKVIGLSASFAIN